MSQSVRQNNLFAAEDWQAIYRSFKDVDFRAYDFDSIRASLIDYIRAHYPEDFNDYIESSEFVAMIELLAYVGTSLNFRVDLNSRENFLDTAERRESIIRLARMLSYNPKRNIATSGLFKLIGVQTNQSITDSLGRDLNNTTVFWNDPNNPDGFEQFTTILNAAFKSSNPFGRPSKSGTLGGIPSDLYDMNSVPNVEVSYNLNISVRGKQYPFDIVNPDFTDGEYFYERHPNPANSFNLIYRNDGEGMGSANTGFFLMFKQGQLQRQDNRYDFPIRNRTTDISFSNVNETDVYMQEIDQGGNVIEEWTKVPSLVGTNVIFNSISNSVRSIFSVIPRLNDQITLKFADGNFGDVPVGTYRTWARTSANKNVTLRPEDVRNYEIRIPYYGADGQEYSLRLIFSLEATVANGAAAETNEQIKERAPQVFYTQNRMVNGEDYNIFPLTRGQEIRKIKALNRTHAGHSRYIDINDPTGTAQNLLVFGDDGALYEDNEPARLEVGATQNASTITSADLNNFLEVQELRNFFYGTYRTAYLVANPNAFNVSNNIPSFGAASLYWEPQPKKSQNDTGFFKTSTGATTTPVPISNPVSGLSPITFLKTGCAVRFVDSLSTPTVEDWVTVQSIINDGVPVSETSLTETGPIEFNKEIIKDRIALDLVPNFRTTFNATEAAAVSTAISARADFGIGYNIESNDREGAWYVIVPPSAPDGTETFDISGWGTSSWLVFCSYDAVDMVWNFTTRGSRYIFESFEDVRFYFDPANLAINVETGLSLKDQIEILKTNTLTIRGTDSYITGLQTVSSGTAGYKVGETLTIDGGTFTTAGTIDVTSVSTIAAQDETAFGVAWAPGIGYAVSDTITLYDGTVVQVDNVDTTYLTTIAGQTEADFDFPTTAANGTINDPGTLHNIGDRLTMSDGTVILVTSVAGSVIDGFTILSRSTSTISTASILTLASSTGDGSVFTITTNTNNEQSSDGVLEFTVLSASTTGISIDNATLTQTSTSGVGVGFALNTIVDANQTIFATSISDPGNYSVTPNNPVTASVGSASGTGATFTLTFSTYGDPLGEPVPLQLDALVMYEDGYYDPRKIEVSPPDADDDGVPDDPLAIVDLLYNGGTEYTVFSERFTDFDGYEYFQLWSAGQLDVGGAFALTELSPGSGDWLINSGTSASLVDLLWTTLNPADIGSTILAVPAGTQLASAVAQFNGMVIYSNFGGTYAFYKITQTGTYTLTVDATTDYTARPGRSFELDTNAATNPFYFKWKHYAPRANRIDPSVSNIIDMVLLTNTYYTDVLTWKARNDITESIPVPPTTEDLRIQFSDLEEFKMLSDQIIYKPAQFKLLFGASAASELQATFKVVKVANATLTDNEIKSKVIQAIDTYFSINNWDFGESFYYTELSAYIHQQLANTIASIVIVPQKAESVFGNLFQVKAESNELFLSTASVSDVVIVRNLTDTNLRISSNSTN
jgi:hypothetical protein